ncbi:MAG TPA: TetR/AcrR family transcriptional regulator [Candidatus Acidoferrales bacterium]|nr:TetR/AcrR family transcriptional regulator [Candidatus Acidoferrales bacterium]
MARPREFDRAVALEKAIEIFSTQGYAGTSTEDLLKGAGIGRQSLYNAFGDKRRLYLEAIAAYVERTTAAHVKRLNAPLSAAQGIRDLLSGLVVDDDAQRALGCLGVSSVGEFGMTDPDLAALRATGGPRIFARLVERLCEGQERGEVDAAMDVHDAAAFIQMTMNGLQVAARGGASADDLRRIAHFAADRITTNAHEVVERPVPRRRPATA